jgi:predicted O-methyltransferase YrrM
MNDLIRQIYRTNYVQDAGENLINAELSAVEYDDGMALYNLVRKSGAKNTLEIGLAYGLSALFVCQAHCDQGESGSHTAIDPQQSSYWKSIGSLNIERAGLGRFFQLYEGCSYTVLPQLLEKNARFDLIFIDGMHTFDYTLVDFFYADLMLNPGGYIIFHDVWMPSVRKALMYVLQNRNYRLAPESLWDPTNLGKRIWRFFNKVSAKSVRMKLTAKHMVQHPLDMASISSALYLSMKGGIKYWGVQKIKDDTRQWDFHRTF